MKKSNSFFGTLLTLIMLVTACTPKATPTQISTAVPTQSPTELPNPDLYLNIIWHQHQPFYPIDPATGLVSSPWVRLHAAKDYVDMAAMLENYPNIHVTFNLTPSLIRQLDAFDSGTRDLAWSMTLVPADQLTTDQKTYLLQRFFDVNGNIISRFPRFVELQQKRVGASQDQIYAAIASWTAQDYLDLQVLFNLAWTDPGYLAEAPLSDLVVKGRNFTEADKQIVLNRQAELVAEVIPEHKKLQDSGQIEITFTPYAHPILPLLIDTNLASIAVPDISLPTRFTHGDDAILQIQRGMDLYQQHFGQAPRGMWPAEGAVAQYMVGMVSRAGVKWMATDEGILANSLTLDFTRDASGVPDNATDLYRPYTVTSSGQSVTVFFRDASLSNKISFDYSNLPAQTAVDDFMSRLHAIRDAVKGQPVGPYVVTVLLDGENAWEYYANDGKDFLNGLYSAISGDPTIKTVTSTEFLALDQQTPPTIPDLWAGSWDSANFTTWIGEDEENRAWDALGTVRGTFEEYLNGAKKGSVDQAAVDKAYNAVLAAEGSDWFWWFGADKDSGNDSAFDAGFRETLGQVYDALGLARPAFLSVPIIQPTPLEPDTPLQDAFTPVVDGSLTPPSKWDNAGRFVFSTTAPSGLDFTFDKNAMYLAVSKPPLGGYSIYLKVPAISTGSPFSEAGQMLGFYATHRIQVQSNGTEAALQKWNNDSGAWENVQSTGFKFATTTNLSEIAVPLADLYPTLDTGDSILFRVVSGGDLLPSAAPGRMLLPDLGRTAWVVDVSDPAKDDHGPGSYTYPTDGVFKPGVFDIVNFEVGTDDNNLVFRFEMTGPVENSWNSALGLSIQSIDLYIDTDGPASGARLFRYGRNAALTSDHAWDYAISVDGWNGGVFAAFDPEKSLGSIPLTILTDPGKHLIVAKIPLGSIPGDPTDWAYAVAVMSHDGYGINAIRDVTAAGGQWAIGGGPADSNHTRIMDYLWPEGASPTQEEMLSAYTPSQADAGSLTADDFPQVQMVTIQK